MYQTINDEQRAKLDALGARWRKNVPEQDRDAHRALKLELYNEARKAFLPSKHFAEEEELFQDMFSEFVEQFQPETQTASDFMLSVLVDLYREFTPPEEDAGFDSGISLHITDDINKVSATDLYSEGWFYEISSQILEFAEKHDENKKDRATLSDYRLFYTAGIIEYCQRMRAFAPPFQHERDILCSMKYPFSDYCLNEICRSIAALYQARLKQYGKVSDLCEESKKFQEIPLPIPADVGVCYLERKEERLITESMYQEKLQAYDQKMRELFRKPIK